MSTLPAERTSALAPVRDASATTARAEMTFTREQVELIKRTICRGATDDELALFLYTAKRLGLDPLARQIYAVKRWDAQLQREVMAIQVGIDGFRVTAERSGKYTGQTATQWCGPDGAWRDVWLEDGPPAAARAGVLHADFREPIYCIARYKSYVQTKANGTPVAMWNRMVDVMLAKCAEAQALRKAFPADLSGVYAPEELAHVETSEARQSADPALVERAAEPLRERIAASQSLDELKGAAAEIQKHPKAVQDAVRDAYGRRMRQLKEAAPKPAPALPPAPAAPPDDIREPGADEDDDEDGGAP